jgi:hypothetical protein
MNVATGAAMSALPPNMTAILLGFYIVGDDAEHSLERAVLATPESRRLFGIGLGRYLREHYDIPVEGVSPGFLGNSSDAIFTLAANYEEAALKLIQLDSCYPIPSSSLVAKLAHAPVILDSIESPDATHYSKLNFVDAKDPAKISSSVSVPIAIDVPSSPSPSLDTSASRRSYVKRAPQCQHVRILSGRRQAQCRRGTKKGSYCYLHQQLYGTLCLYKFRAIFDCFPLSERPATPISTFFKSAAAALTTPIPSRMS